MKCLEKQQIGSRQGKHYCNLDCNKLLKVLSVVELLVEEKELVV